MFHLTKQQMIIVTCDGCGKRIKEIDTNNNGMTTFYGKSPSNYFIEGIGSSSLIFIGEEDVNVQKEITRADFCSVKCMRKFLNAKIRELEKHRQNEIKRKWGREE